MAETKIVKAHSDIRKLVEVAHYEDHLKRTESAEFIKVRNEFHQEHAKCWIGRHCEGGIEIHHNIIEYSANSEVDWDKVHEDHPEVKDVDCKEQMLPLCRKHHRDAGFGIHDMTYPIWQLQRYMKPEALDNFELATYREIFFEKLMKSGQHSHDEAMKLAQEQAQKKVESFKVKDV